MLTSGQAQRLLVDRGCDGGGDVAVERQADQARDGVVGQPAGRCRNLAGRTDPGRQASCLQYVDLALLKAGFVQCLDGPDGDRQAADALGRVPQATGMPDDDRTADPAHFRIGQAFDANFRPYAGRVAHADADQGPCLAVHRSGSSSTRYRCQTVE